MRIVTWNMEYWSRPADQRKQAWAFIKEHLKPDIALVQEANPPPNIGETVFRPGGILDDRTLPAKNRGWGSAVVSFVPKIAPIEHAITPFDPKHPAALLRTFPGSVAIARVESNEPLVVVSAYGVFDHKDANSTVHRILSDLTPLIDELDCTRLIIAGDLNISTQWSDKHKSLLMGKQKEFLLQEQNLFERFKILGLHNIVLGSSPLKDCDCHDGVACRHVQTQRHNISKFPFQNDYVFVSEDILNQSPKIKIIDDEAAWDLSSHCPIVVELPDL